MNMATGLKNGLDVSVYHPESYQRGGHRAIRNTLLCVIKREAASSYEYPGWWTSYD